MKSKQTETEKTPIFRTATSLSDPNAWFISLVRQIRQYRAERRNPPPRVEIYSGAGPGCIGSPRESAESNCLPDIGSEGSHPREVSIRITSKRLRRRLQ